MCAHLSWLAESKLTPWIITIFPTRKRNAFKIIISIEETQNVYIYKMWPSCAIYIYTKCYHRKRHTVVFPSKYFLSPLKYIDYLSCQFLTKFWQFAWEIVFKSYGKKKQWMRLLSVTQSKGMFIKVLQCVLIHPMDHS